MEQSCLESLISSASFSSLKIVEHRIRYFPMNTPGAEETISHLFESHQSHPLQDIQEKSILQEIMLQACDQIEEVRVRVAELLSGYDAAAELSMAEAKAFTQRLIERQKIEDESGYESARSSSLEILDEPAQSQSKKRKFKWKPETVPRSAPKKRKSSQSTIQHSPSNHEEESSLEVKSSNLGVEPAAKSSKNTTLDYLFDADAAHQAKAEEDEIARIKEVPDAIDKDEAIKECARCSKTFKEKDNTEGSCAVHPGQSRRYHPSLKEATKQWSCCGRLRHDVGCNKSKHVDVNTPGAEMSFRNLQIQGLVEVTENMMMPCSKCGQHVKIYIGGTDGTDYLLDTVFCDACNPDNDNDKVMKDCANCGVRFILRPEDIGLEEEYCDDGECQEVKDRGEEEELKMCDRCDTYYDEYAEENEDLEDGLCRECTNKMMGVASPSSVESPSSDL